MDIQQATLLETLTLYADKTQQQRDIVVTDRMSQETELVHQHASQRKCSTTAMQAGAHRGMSRNQPISAGARNQ